MSTITSNSFAGIGILTELGEDFSACIRDKISDFLFQSDCCSLCSREELIKHLFYNDIDTIINYTITPDVLTQEEINQLVSLPDCLYCGAPAVSGTGTMAGRPIKACCCSDSDGGGDGDGGSEEIQKSFKHIGYYSNELTYTEDISGINYPVDTYAIIDYSYKALGMINDEDELLAALISLGLGDWTIVGGELIYIGFHQFQGLIKIGDVASGPSYLQVQTTNPISMLNIYGSTAFDISLENTMVGNTDLIAKIAALNFRFLCWPTGAVINWTHYISGTGDGWNSLEADATDRGKDYTLVQGGDLYNGGVPWGRDFMVEFIYLINQLNALSPGHIAEVVIGVNIAFPLIPFSNDTINFAGIDYDALKDEIALAAAKVATTTATIKILEFGMELITNSFSDLFVNTGGTLTKAEILKELLTTKILTGVILGVPQYTDSIIEYTKDLLPSALISIDGRLWDDTTSHDDDWVGVLTAVDGIDCIRDYYQFKDGEAVSYATVRKKIADRVDFWAYMEDTDHNGKKVFISQMTVKATSIIRNTVANGLLIAEMYMQMTRDNLDHDNKLVGMTHMNIKQLFDINDGYALKVHYAFVKQLGEFFDNSQKLIAITGTDSTINNNLVLLAIKVDTEVRIAVLNPTAVDIEVTGLSVNGVLVEAADFSVDQNYADDAEDPLSLTATHVVENVLHFRPYSFSIITTTVEEDGDVDAKLLQLDTTAPVDMLNIYGSSAFDISVENTLVGNTTLINNIKALKLKFLAYPTGAILNWIHYPETGGDGWGSLEADATARGLDYTTVQDGFLYHGGVPYGRYFPTEYCYLLDQAEVTEAVIGLNILMPLIPFSGVMINWATVDFQSLKDEFDNIVALVAATNATITIVELGMEDITSAFADLLDNPGGAEVTKARVIERLLTEVDNGFSIIGYIKATLPDAILSIDGKLWDDAFPHDSDWNDVLSAIVGIDVVRQYYQFYDPYCVDYPTARARVAARTDFWAVVNGPKFNGKGVFISQTEIKALNPVRSTVAAGLIMAELYLTMSTDNIDNDNKLVGLAYMNVKQLFKVNAGYAKNPHYAFFERLGEFFDNDQQNVQVTTNQSDANNNLVIRAILIDGTPRVAVLNPTGTAIELEAITVNGTDADTFSVKQTYCTDETDPLTDDSTTVTETVLNFRPYSFSIITFPEP